MPARDVPQRLAVAPQEALILLDGLREHREPTIRRQAARKTKKAAKAGAASSG